MTNQARKIKFKSWMKIVSDELSNQPAYERIASYLEKIMLNDEAEYYLHKRCKYNNKTPRSYARRFNKYLHQAKTIDEILTGENPEFTAWFERLICCFFECKKRIGMMKVNNIVINEVDLICKKNEAIQKSHGMDIDFLINKISCGNDQEVQKLELLYMLVNAFFDNKNLELVADEVMKICWPRIKNPKVLSGFLTFEVYFKA